MTGTSIDGLVRPFVDEYETYGENGKGQEGTYTPTDHERALIEDALHGFIAEHFPPQSVLQPWVVALPFMQQSVLIAAVRAPDGLRKDHPVKVIMRWYRRCVLFGAFDRNVFATPFCPGGGSFTGPFTPEHAQQYCGSVGAGFYWRGNTVPADPQQQFDHMREVYLRYVDEMPHHFQLHLMHAAQIIGYKHPDPATREWWSIFYRMIVNDAHLFPESEELMDMRLGDTEAGWRAREEVTAL